METARSWVSVAVFPPLERTNVLAYGKKHRNVYCAFLHEGVWFYFKATGQLEAIDDEITHWMSVPKAPQDGRNEL